MSRLKNIRMSGRKSLLLFCAVYCMFLGFHSPAWAIGKIPVPEVHDVNVKAGASYDSTSKWYRYTYSVASGSANRGEVWKFTVDIHKDPKYRGTLLPHGLTIPYFIRDKSFLEATASLYPLLLPPGYGLVPIGQEVPTGWYGGVGRNGYAIFYASDSLYKILPGDSRGPFTIVSPGVPTIREAVVHPDWILSLDGEADKQILRQAGKIEAEIEVPVHTLGPSDLLGFGSDDHWDRFAIDIEKLSGLGWITDAALKDAILVQLRSARDALDADDGTLAKQRLQPIRTLIADSKISQRNQEAHDLVALNIQSLIEHTLDTPIPFKPVYSLTPETAQHNLGKPHTLIASALNSANKNEPIVGFPFALYIIEGPHAGVAFYGNTDQDGKERFTYAGERPGRDRVVVVEESIPVLRTDPGMPNKREHSLNEKSDTPNKPNGKFFISPDQVLAEAEVIWEGGSDMVVPFFMPPLLISAPGNTVYISETTANFGNLPSPQTTTAYFIKGGGYSGPLGQRTVPPLNPGEYAEEVTLEFVVPDAFPEGEFSLKACADYYAETAELDETNNCSDSQLATVHSIVVPMNQEMLNATPECANASAWPESLWPPNHKTEQIEILNVSDPDGQAIAIKVDSIHQDEPVNGPGDGNTSPDGFGIGTSQPSVRRERSGTGNGRIYEIAFTATDSQGASCSGSVIVGVPHDSGQGTPAVDDEIRFDSTVP